MSSECFWCEAESAYHPTCEGAGCSADVHGHGTDGKRVYNYCPSCRTGEERGRA